MPYLMESPREAKRLLLKSEDSSSRHQLQLTGLQEGMTVVDAGAGAGFVSRIISEIVGPKGRVVAVDQSKERLAAAKEHCHGQKNIRFLASDLSHLDLESHSVDYVFCRFVFEYLENPSRVFQEFVRITKSGGKIVVGDLDHNCLSHYPLAPHLEQQLLKIVQALQAKKLWDPYAGRKLFALYNEAPMLDIKVHLLPHHLIYGESDVRDVENWQAKIEQIRELQNRGVINLDFDLKAFRDEFFAFFENPGRFSYSPLILVEGIKK